MIRETQPEIADGRFVMIAPSAACFVKWEQKK